MSWNYRIVRYADGSGYGLHEVYYEKDGTPRNMTAEPVSFVGDSRNEVYADLVLAKMDAMKRPVFDEPAEWRESERREVRAAPPPEREDR